MIAWSDKIEKSRKIFPGVIDKLQKQGVDIDGVIEVFNDGVEQGTLLKIFDKFDPQVDMCIWAYLPQEREFNNQMEVLIGHHSDCSKNNMWNTNVKSKVFIQPKSRDLHNEVRDYIVEAINSNYDKKIDMGKELDYEN